MGKNKNIFDGKDTAVTPDEIIADMEENGINGPSGGDIMDSMLDEDGAGMLSTLTSQFDFSGMWDKLYKTNKDATMDVLGSKVSHVAVMMVMKTAQAMVPENTQVGRAIRSDLVNVLLYGVLSQSIVIGANALIPVHPKFQFIAGGASRNSIEYTAGALGLVQKLSKFHPLIGKFFS